MRGGSGGQRRGKKRERGTEWIRGESKTIQGVNLNRYVCGLSMEARGYPVLALPGKPRGILPQIWRLAQLRHCHSIAAFGTIAGTERFYIG